MHRLKEKDNTLFVTLSLRKYIPLFITQGILITIILLALIFIPNKGTLLFEIGKTTIYWGRALYLLLSLPIIMIILALPIERILYVRSFKIFFSKRNLEYSFGIFNKTVESVDMFTITDFVQKSDLMDQLLGISNIVIHSEDVRTPLIKFEGLLLPDARAIIDYLQLNATNTIVEYLVNDKQKNGNGNNKGMDADQITTLQMMEEKEKKAKASKIITQQNHREP
ncbi:PH domain-containing protein [Candidatus Dojkabacteria bacterium]|nr:PH domain-containing protein [Candidatus Dojkabacteria bacterium]